MGKFDGILIATDLDATFLNDKRQITPENKSAIEYFMSEGGYFTIATGRSIRGLSFVFDVFTPNAPLILYNGAMIYDLKNGKVLEESFLDPKLSGLLKKIESEFSFAGIQVCSGSSAYITRDNSRIKHILKAENVTGNYKHFSEVEMPWRKAIFVQEADELPIIREAIYESEYKDICNVMQSSPYYLEVLPLSATKGNALKRVAHHLGIPQDKTIGLGDNENDIPLIKAARYGIAVSNAIPQLLEVANIITVDNNSHAIAKTIYDIEKNIITF